MTSSILRRSLGLDLHVDFCLSTWSHDLCLIETFGCVFVCNCSNRFLILVHISGCKYFLLGASTNIDGFPFFDYVFTRRASHERTFKMDFRSPPCKRQESWLEKHEHERPCNKATFFRTSKPSLFLMFQLKVCGIWVMSYCLFDIL